MARRDQIKHISSRFWSILLLLTLISVFCLGCASAPEAQPPLTEVRDEGGAEQSEKRVATATEEPAAEPTSCVSGDSHPLAEGIAEEFDVEFEQVIDWFCQGNTFDDILLALQTSDLTEEPPGELLAMLDEMSWDQIWDELGVTSLDSSQ